MEVMSNLTLELRIQKFKKLYDFKVIFVIFTVFMYKQ